MSMSIQIDNHSEISLAGMTIAFVVGKIIEELVKAESLLASLSYVIAIVAGLLTIYSKIRQLRNKRKE